MLHPAVWGSLGSQRIKTFCDIMAGGCVNTWTVKKLQSHRIKTGNKWKSKYKAKITLPRHWRDSGQKRNGGRSYPYSHGLWGWLMSVYENQNVKYPRTVFLGVKEQLACGRIYIKETANTNKRLMFPQRVGLPALQCLYLLKMFIY